MDYSDEPHTPVEFRLESTEEGTRLSISESGFDGLPDEENRADVLRRNTQGWNAQADHIIAHVES